MRRGNALRRPQKERAGLLWNGVVKLLENSSIPAVKKLPADLISEYVIGQNLTMLKQQYFVLGGGWRRDDRDREGPRDEGSTWRRSGERDGPRRGLRLS